MLENLIYDRTLANVNTIKNLKTIRYQDMTDAQKQEWVSNLKGCYTYEDLNRVEEATEYVGARLVDFGLTIELQPKKTWVANEVPSLVDIQRYLDNIKAIRAVGPVMSTTPQAPSSPKIGYADANAIEKILYDVDLLISNVVLAYSYSGEMICGG